MFDDLVVHLNTYVDPGLLLINSSSCSDLVGFEERAASLYLSFARRFVRNQDLSWFWLEMSMEEKQHALLMQFCGCENLLPMNLPDRSTIRKLSDFFAALEKRASRRKLSVEEAFLIAAELEASEINNIYGRLIGPVQGTAYILRKKIQTLLPGHMDSLIRAARKFKVSPATLSRLPEVKRAEFRKAS